MTDNAPPPSVARMLAMAAENRERAVPKAPPSSRRNIVAASRVGRESYASITGVHTALLTLTPAFIDALKKVAPKKRRSRVPYVIAFGLFAVVAMLAIDPSTREFGVAHLRSAPAAQPVAPTVAPPPEAPAPVAVTTLTSGDPTSTSLGTAIIPVVASTATTRAPAKADPPSSPSAEPAKTVVAKTAPPAPPRRSPGRPARPLPMRSAPF